MYEWRGNEECCNTGYTPFATHCPAFRNFDTLRMRMKFSNEQKFFYSRLAILAAGLGSTIFAVAGFSGLPFWHIGFALCVWLAFALQNFHHKTSLWMCLRRRIPFLIFYGALAGSFILFDTLALRLHLWFYPFYSGAWFMFVYGILYPIGALAAFEFFYFLASRVQEELMCKQLKETAMRRSIHKGESVLFLLMMALIIFGAAGYPVSFIALFIVCAAWSAAAAFTLGSCLAYPAHLVLLISTAAFGALVGGVPGAAPFERIYSEMSVLNTPVFSIPLWMWLGSLWFVLFPLRLWMFLTFHPRAR